MPQWNTKKDSMFDCNDQVKEFWLIYFQLAIPLTDSCITTIVHTHMQLTNLTDINTCYHNVKAKYFEG